VHRVAHCRICKNSELSLVFDLGSQPLMGVFSKSFDEHVSHRPLIFVKCTEKSGDYELVRQRHSYQQKLMHGDNHGYQLAFDQSIVKHLRRRVERGEKANTAGICRDHARPRLNGAPCIWAERLHAAVNRSVGHRIRVRETAGKAHRVFIFDRRCRGGETDLTRRER